MLRLDVSLEDHLFSKLMGPRMVDSMLPDEPKDTPREPPLTSPGYGLPTAIFSVPHLHRARTVVEAGSSAQRRTEASAPGSEAPESAEQVLSKYLIGLKVGIILHTLSRRVIQTK